MRASSKRVQPGSARQVGLQGSLRADRERQPGERAEHQPPTSLLGFAPERIGHVPAIQALADLGCDTKATDQQGWTAMMHSDWVLTSK